MIAIGNGVWKFEYLGVSNFVTGLPLGNFIGFYRSNHWSDESVNLVKKISTFWKAPRVIAMNLNHTANVLVLDSTTEILWINELLGKTVKQVDAIVTLKRQSFVTINTIILSFLRDCTNVILNGKITCAIIHISRHNANQIIKNTIDTMVGFGENPAQIRAGISHGICKNCFSFDTESEQAQQIYDMFPYKQFESLYEQKKGKTHFDLNAAVLLSLIENGVKNFENMGGEIFCSKHSQYHGSFMFHSYRRTKELNNQRRPRFQLPEGSNASGFVLYHNSKTN